MSRSVPPNELRGGLEDVSGYVLTNVPEDVLQKVSTKGTANPPSNLSPSASSNRLTNPRSNRVPLASPNPSRNGPKDDFKCGAAFGLGGRGVVLGEMVNSELRIDRLRYGLEPGRKYTIVYIGDLKMPEETDRFQMTKELGQRLRELRERVGLTQSELARDGLDRQLGRKGTHEEEGERGNDKVREAAAPDVQGWFRSDSCLGLRQRELPPFGTPDREKRERRSRSPKLSSGLLTRRFAGR